MLFVHGMKSDLGDIVFPDYPFQKYGLEAYTDGIGTLERQVMFKFSDQIPGTITSYESADYQIVKNDADNFGNKFSEVNRAIIGLKCPRRYILEFISSPDAPVIHPITFFKNLNSTLLQGFSPDQTISSTFEMDNFMDLNYQQFSDFLAQLREK